MSPMVELPRVNPYLSKTAEQIFDRFQIVCIGLFDEMHFEKLSKNCEERKKVAQEITDLKEALRHRFKSMRDLIPDIQAIEKFYKGLDLETRLEEMRKFFK